MDVRQFAEKASKIIGTTKVVVASIQYKDTDYEIHTNSDAYATETGWVAIAKLVPSNSSLPEFVFRWDHGSAETDVDIFFGGKKRKDLWGGVGYEGHKTVLVNTAGSGYEASISIPDRLIFKGVIHVGLMQGLIIHDTISLSDNVDIQIIS